MNFNDLAAAELWRAEMAERRKVGGDLYFHRLRPEVLELWRRIGFIAELGEDHLFASKRVALAAIVPRLEASVCAGCHVRVFEECRHRPAPPGPGQAAVMNSALASAIGHDVSI
jgi:SulP family sulfate permease